MCFASLKSRTCFDVNCKFVHVKGTRRKKDDKLSNITQNKSATKSDFTVEDRSVVTNAESDNKNSGHSNNFLEMFHCLIQAVEERMEKKLNAMAELLQTVRPVTKHHPQINHVPPNLQNWGPPLINHPVRYPPNPQYQ